MTKRQRNEQQPFTIDELELIHTCLMDEEPLELVGTKELNFTYAIKAQLPDLFHVWRAKDRADAEAFYEQGVLWHIIKTMKDKEQNGSR
jgi:hypothetical protein